MFEWHTWHLLQRTLDFRSFSIILRRKAWAWIIQWFEEWLPDFYGTYDLIFIVDRAKQSVRQSLRRKGRPSSMKSRLVTASPPVLPPIPASDKAEPCAEVSSPTTVTPPGSFKHSRSDYGLQQRRGTEQIPEQEPLLPCQEEQTTTSAAATSPPAGNGHPSKSRFSSVPSDSKTDDQLESCVIAPRIPPPPSLTTSGSTRQVCHFRNYCHAIKRTNAI